MTKLDRVRTVDIRHKLKQEAVMEMLERSIARKVKIDDMEGERLVRQVYSEQVTGRRPRGSPRNIGLITSISKLYYLLPVMCIQMM